MIFFQYSHVKGVYEHYVIQRFSRHLHVADDLFENYRVLKFVAKTEIYKRVKGFLHHKHQWLMLGVLSLP